MLPAIGQGGGDEVSGGLSILHVTRDAEARTICGALFNPATQEQQTALKAIIDRVNKP